MAWRHQRGNEFGSSDFVVVCAHFYPRLTNELRRQYEDFRSQFLTREIPLRTLAVGRHYEPWRVDYPELQLVDGDLLFQKERLWTLGATLADGEGFRRFLCLDADLVFEGDGWAGRLSKAFERYDVFQPYERIVHLYDDEQVHRRTTLRYPLRLSGSQSDFRRAQLHKAYRYYLRRILGTTHALGFGLGFNSRYLHSIGLYEYAIVGGGDRILWSALSWLLHPPTHERRQEVLDTFIASAGLPQTSGFRNSLSSWLDQAQCSTEPLRIGYANRVTAVSLPTGRRTSRRYQDRNEILADFDPARDVRADPGHGLVFTDSAFQLERDVREYMNARIA